MRLVAAAIASCNGAIERNLLPPPEYVYVVDGVMCTVMQCMLDDSDVAISMCCVRAIHTEFPYPPKRKPPRPPGAPPETLTSADVKTSIAPIYGRLDACREKYPGPATPGVTMKVHVVVAPSGAVESSTADPPSGDDAFDACATAAFRRARFPASEKGASFRYPFFRR